MRARLIRGFVLTAVACGLAVFAVVLTWPLALNLKTALPGDPAGDTGVYVWNLWIFRHELVTHGHWPFATDHIFAFTGGSDFGLHNYTPLADMLALPLIPWVGVVGAFNLVLMTVLALSGWGVYVLGRQVGLRRLPACAAGALFMATPLISARETAHLSLVTNAALPLFLWALLRTLDRPSVRGGVLVGVIVAAATLSDAYYGIYCVIMGLFVLAWRFLRLDASTARGDASNRRRWVDAAIVAILLSAWLPVLLGVDSLAIGGLRLRGLDAPYALAVLLVVAVLLRAWLTWRPSLRLADGAVLRPGMMKAGLVAVAVSLLLLSPLLIAIAVRYESGRLPETVTYWRSSPRGADLLAYVVPNPVHAIIGRWTERWLLPGAEDAFPELVASCSVIALAGIAFAATRRVVPRMWQAFTALFVLLSLGPFIHIGGVNTFVIGPWALLRYVPVIGMARSPSRFAIVAAMGVALLFGFALNAWLEDARRWRATAVAMFGALVALEVIPGPRTLHSASVPEIYQLLAVSGDEQSRLLELPTGIRDGTSSLGDFNASTAYFQTQHHRPLMGGYLSRVSEWRKRESMRAPMLEALYALSAGPGPLDDALALAARESREAFLARSCVKYVVVDKRRASADLRAFATAALGLALVHDDERYQLLTPSNPPECEPRAGSIAVSTKLATH